MRVYADTKDGWRLRSQRISHISPAWLVNKGHALFLVLESLCKRHPLGRHCGMGQHHLFVGGLLIIEMQPQVGVHAVIQILRTSTTALSLSPRIPASNQP